MPFVLSSVGRGQGPSVTSHHPHLILPRLRPHRQPERQSYFRSRQHERRQVLGRRVAARDAVLAQVERDGHGPGVGDDLFRSRRRSGRGLAAAAGAWLIVAPFVLEGPDHPAGIWNDVVVGAVVVVLSMWSAVRAR